MNLKATHSNFQTASCQKYNEAIRTIDQESKLDNIETIPKMSMSLVNIDTWSSVGLFNYHDQQSSTVLLSRNVRLLGLEIQPFWTIIMGGGGGYTGLPPPSALITLSSSSHEKIQKKWDGPEIQHQAISFCPSLPPYIFSHNYTYKYHYYIYIYTRMFTTI